MNVGVLIREYKSSTDELKMAIPAMGSNPLPINPNITLPAGIELTDNATSALVVVLQDTLLHKGALIVKIYVELSNSTDDAPSFIYPHIHTGNEPALVQLAYIGAPVPQGNIIQCRRFSESSGNEESLQSVVRPYGSFECQTKRFSMFFLVPVQEDEYDIAPFLDVIIACVSIDLFLIVIAIHAGCSADWHPGRRGKYKQDTTYEALPYSPIRGHPNMRLAEEEKEKMDVNNYVSPYALASGGHIVLTDDEGPQDPRSRSAI